MDEGEIIKQIGEQNEQLRCENELLKAKIIKLEARLAQYENAHTPPGLRRSVEPASNGASRGLCDHKSF